MSVSRTTIAVVIPFYDGGDFIERALASVVSQSRVPDDVVVVDDGSNEPHAEALRRIAPQYGARVIRQENSGQSSARNRGVRSTDTTHICFLDQDDFFLPHHIELLDNAVSPSNGERADWAYGDARRVARDGHTVLQESVVQNSKHPKLQLVDYLGEDLFILPSASIVTRAMFDALNGFDITLRGYEDDDFFLRAFVRGFVGRFVDEPVLAWTLNTESSSHSPTMAQSRLRYMVRLSELVAQLPLKDKAVAEAAVYPRFVFAFLYDLIHAYATNSNSAQATDLFVRSTALSRHAGYRFSPERRFAFLLVALWRVLPDGFSRRTARVILHRRLKFLRRQIIKRSDLNL